MQNYFSLLKIKKSILLRKFYNQKTNNLHCLPYQIKKFNLNKLYRKQDLSHRHMSNRCNNTFDISNKLMNNYKNVKNMFIHNYPLFDKV